MSLAILAFGPHPDDVELITRAATQGLAPDEGDEAAALESALLLLGSLLVGSLPGIWLGSQLSAKVPEQLLRRLLALMLVLVGTKLISA